MELVILKKEVSGNVVVSWPPLTVGGWKWIDWIDRVSLGKCTSIVRLSVKTSDRPEWPR